MKRALNHAALASCALLAAASVHALPRMMERRELERREQAEREAEYRNGREPGEVLVIDDPETGRERPALSYLREKIAVAGGPDILTGLPPGVTDAEIREVCSRLVDEELARRMEDRILYGDRRADRYTPIASTLASAFPRPRRQAAYKQVITHFTSTPRRRRGLTSAAKRQGVRRRQGR